MGETPETQSPLDFAEPAEYRGSAL